MLRYRLYTEQFIKRRLIMSFETTAKNIISESIKSAVFIDDEIPELDNTDFCKHQYTVPLYKAFQSSHCSLDFHKFTRIESLNDKLLFERKDLIILDWELDSVEPKFKSTLDIIDRAVDTDNLHFVCIYSHRGDDYQDIFKKILAYYSGNLIQDSENNKNILVDFLDGQGLESAPIISEFKQLTNDYILGFSDKDSYNNDISSLLTSKIEDPKERAMLCKNLSKAYPNSSTEEKAVRLFYDLEGPSVYRSEPKQVYKICKNKYLQINNTFFSVFQKGTHNVDQLFENFSHTISSAKEAFLTFMSLEIRNKLFTKSALVGKELGNINEDAFFFHHNNINPEESFYEFMIELWESYNTSWIYKENLDLFSVIEDYKNEKTFPDKQENTDLAKLNYYYNIDHTITDDARKIAFGDIFSLDKTQEYILCITPHCDCLTPVNIKGFYHFVRGSNIRIEDGLQIGDEGFTSFIKSKDGSIRCIKWSTKPFTLFISEDKRNILRLNEVMYKDNPSNFEYLCSLKENYCQRIANKSFSHPIRVGISFVKTKTENTCKAFVQKTCKHIPEINPEVAKE